MFDPFRDFDTAGYLRNTAGEKNPDIVKRLEHDVFSANLPDAIDFLLQCKTITYEDFLRVHAILFGDLYPWAGQDRAQTAPDVAIRKAGIFFAHPRDARLAVEEGLRIAHNKRQLRKTPGLVIGLFAYGHPFLDCNGRSMLVVHAVLCHRAGFSIDWTRADKAGYLAALSAEIEQPNQGVLDRYLHHYISPASDPGTWAAIMPRIRGLDGAAPGDTVEGSFTDPAVSRQYREFEQRRGYEIAPGDPPAQG